MNGTQFLIVLSEYLKFPKFYPAGTCRKNDVVLTSMRHDYVASTSIRRHFGTKCPLANVFIWESKLKERQ